ncbi:hypothetical protein SNEBB_002742 [Seison nebaliae]|nr:hypothetical protein SNEBB_002742 [Seison nebaliae]
MDCSFMSGSSYSAPSFQTGEELCTVHLEKELRPTEERTVAELTNLFNWTVAYFKNNRKIDRNMAYSSELPLYGAEVISMKNRELFERTKNSVWQRHIDFDSAVTTLDSMMRIIDKKFECVKSDIAKCRDSVSTNHDGNGVVEKEKGENSMDVYRKKKKKRKKTFKFFTSPSKKLRISNNRWMEMTTISLDMRKLRAIDYGSINGLLQYSCKWKKLLYGKILMVTDYDIMNDIREMSNDALNQSRLFEILIRTEKKEDNYLNFYCGVLEKLTGRIPLHKQFTISSLIDSFVVQGRNDVTVDDFYLYEKEIESDSCSTISRLSSIPSDNEHYFENENSFEIQNFSLRSFSIVSRDTTIRNHMNTINFTDCPSVNLSNDQTSIQQILAECANDMFGGDDDDIKLKRLYVGMKRRKVQIKRSNNRTERTEKNKEQTIGSLDDWMEEKSSKLLPLRTRTKRKRLIKKKLTVNVNVDDIQYNREMNCEETENLFQTVFQIPQMDNRLEWINESFPDSDECPINYQENLNGQFESTECVMGMYSNENSMVSEMTSMNDSNEIMNMSTSFPLLDIPKPLFEPIPIKLDYRKQANRINVKRINQDMFPIIHKLFQSNQPINMRTIFAKYSMENVTHNSYCTPHSLFLAILHLAHEHQLHIRSEMMGMDVVVMATNKSNEDK